MENDLTDYSTLQCYNDVQEFLANQEIKLKLAIDIAEEGLTNIETIREVLSTVRRLQAKELCREVRRKRRRRELGATFAAQIHGSEKGIV